MHLAHNDISSVADAAAQARRDALVRVAEQEVHFGQIDQAADVRHSVRLLGPPLARACTFEASDPWVRLTETAEGVDISVTGRVTGVLHGSVVITGPTGSTVVSVDVEVTPAVPEPPAAAAANAAVRRDPFVLVSGLLAISAGLVVFMGLLPYYRNDDPLPETAPELTWHVLITAAVAVIAGGCTLLPDRARTVGLGVLLCAASTAVPGTLLFFVESAGVSDSVQTGYWLGVIGHVLLVLVAVPAALAVKHAGVARLVRRLLRDGTDLLIVRLGVAGAIAFALQYLLLVNHSPSAVTITVTVLHLWTAATAFVVPWCVVASVPPTFGLAVLIGWITTGSAVFLADNALLLHDDVNRVPGMVFECTLLLLTLPALGIGRRMSRQP